MRLEAKAATLGKLRGADLALEPGRYVVLANEPEPLVSLVAVVAGREPPRRGRVLLNGQAPADSPATRRKVAALFGEETLAPASNVSASVAKALVARGAPATNARRVLEDAQLSQLAQLTVDALGPRETRSVALALALAHDDAELLVLHEPLATQVPAALVLARLDQHTERGALVLATTTSPADAMTLGGHSLCVELGRVRQSAGPLARLGAGPWQQVLVETNDARTLSQLLHASPTGLTTELGASAGSLKITGPALDITVQEVITLARQHGLELRRIEATVPPVEALLAARAGFARAAYEASRAVALSSGPHAAQPNVAQPPAAQPPPPSSMDLP